MAHKDTHNPGGQGQSLGRSHLNRSDINDEVCVRCGQCCRLEEFFDTPGTPLYVEQQNILQNGLVFDQYVPNATPQVMPMVLDLDFIPGRQFITCAHLEQSTNRCTNFDSDGTDLRPNTCKDWYCADGRGSAAIRGNQPNHYWMPDHIDLDIVKVIVDDVRGTNLSGGG